MKNIIFLLFTSCFLLLYNQTAKAQFTPKADFRNRAELRHGYKKLPIANDKAAFFINQRSRFLLGFEQEKLKLGMSIQDVRVWGDEEVFNMTGVSGDKASLEFNEAWFEWMFNPTFSMKSGRQVWNYDDGRLLSNRNWGTGLYYDGVLSKWEKEKWKIHVGLSLNNKQENTFGNDYRYYKTEYVFDTLTNSILVKNKEIDGKMKSLDFIYLKGDLSDNLKISFIALFSSWQQMNTADKYFWKETLGCNLNYKNKQFEMNGSAYYQMGKNIASQEISAYLLSAHVGYSGKKLAVKANATIISGHDQQNQSSAYQNTDHFFDIHYGTRHGFYGHMDLFNSMDVVTEKGGLIDLFMSSAYKINEKNSLSLDIHNFRLHSIVLDNINAPLNSDLGFEADFNYTYQPIKEIEIKGGYMVYAVTESMEYLQNIPVGQSTFPYFAYVMVTVKPSLFSSK